MASGSEVMAPITSPVTNRELLTASSSRITSTATGFSR